MPDSKWRARTSKAAAIGVAAALIGPMAATAQGPSPERRTALPFDDRLMRLSEILGALHYLRELCDGGDGSLWRDQMQALLDSEQPGSDRRAGFVARFNQGYTSFDSVYRTCTPAAELAIDRYLLEGANIARDVAARYGTEE